MNSNFAKLLAIFCLCLISSACQNLPPSFANMSEAELLAYNETKPYLEQVICIREATTSSRIRKRKCLTHEKMLFHNERAAMALEVMNAAPVYSFPRRIGN